MKFLGTLFAVLILAALACLIAWPLGLQGVLRDSIAAGHSLDWIMGGLCLLWLVIILKVPWDLYFQAQGVTFEMQRSRERGVEVVAGREDYIKKLGKRLGLLAIGAHLASAALIAAITYFTGGAIGYYFAAFYLISTLFRPAAAAYAYLSYKLTTIAEETRYPREDVVEIRSRLSSVEQSIRDFTTRLEAIDERLSDEESTRQDETRELRDNVHDLGREFESTISRLTDNQEIIKGLQAFVRLVTRSATT